jgi:hypothetical protein
MTRRSLPGRGIPAAGAGDAHPLWWIAGRACAVHADGGWLSIQASANVGIATPSRGPDVFAA